MHRVTLPDIGTVAAWRAEARRLAGQGVPPETVLWTVGTRSEDLFAVAPPTAGEPIDLRLPKAAVSGIETALHHSDPERFARAYAVVIRMARKELRWNDRTDPALHRLLGQEKAVRRDIHKMHAFVRFREVGEPGRPRRAFAAWFEPDHPIVEAAAPFFARRFGDMDWIIATPTLTARFENGTLRYDVTRSTARPPKAPTDDLWRAYFANIFNPARLMVSAMTSEMPRKYWKNLPEAELIPDLIRTAPARARAMQDALPSIPPARAAKLRPERIPVPSTDDVSLDTMKQALDACRRCPIGHCATQGVAGEGPASARLMIVGEQPGDQEDLAGRPFVGPAGQLFDRSAAKAGIDRRQVYVTNAVKHFKFTPRGKRRLHQRPDAGEVSHCKWWLDIERRLVRPTLTVAMGATAALALTGSGASITRRRGQIERLADGTPLLVTVHPSYLLRLPDAAQRTDAEAAFVEDLKLAARYAPA
jgi:probable DNA metabolism protein